MSKVQGLFVGDLGLVAGVRGLFATFEDVKETVEGMLMLANLARMGRRLSTGAYYHEDKVMMWPLTHT